MFASEPTQPQPAPGILDAALRYRKLTTVVPLIGAVIGLLVTVLTPSSFTAIGKLTLADPTGSTIFAAGSSASDLSRYVAERSEFALSSTVLESAAQSFPRAGSAADLREACGVNPSTDSGILSVECTFSEERTALGAVEAIVGAYRLATSTQTTAKADKALAAIDEERATITEQLRSSVSGDPFSGPFADAAAVRLAQLDENASNIRTAQSLFGDGVDSYDPARVPPSAGFLSQALRNVVVGAVVGLIGAVLVAWFRADRTPIGEASAEVSTWLDLPLLGEIDHELVRGNSIDMIAVPDPSFQRITSNLEAVLVGETVLFTPAEPMAHHEDIVVKAALVAARAGKRVLLIDADQSGRSVSTALGLPEGAGFADFVSGEATAEEATVRLGFGRNTSTESSSLYLMAPGADVAQQSGLLRTGDAETALTELRRHYDLILVAGPPLLSSAGSAVLGQAVDGVLVIIERGIARTALEDARRQLNFLASETLGFVFVHNS